MKYILVKDLSARIGDCKYEGKEGDTIDVKHDHHKYFESYVKCIEEVKDIDESNSKKTRKKSKK